jgi:hypothetical protein
LGSLLTAPACSSDTEIALPDPVQSIEYYDAFARTIINQLKSSNGREFWLSKSMEIKSENNSSPKISENLRKAGNDYFIIIKSSPIKTINEFKIVSRDYRIKLSKSKLPENEYVAIMKFLALYEATFIEIVENDAANANFNISKRIEISKALECGISLAGLGVGEIGMIAVLAAPNPAFLVGVAVVGLGLGIFGAVYGCS